jgi:hypothetical protein
MRIRRSLPSALLVAGAVASAAALLLASGALADTPPTAAALLTRSAAALKAKDAFHLTLAEHSTAVSDGSLTAAQLHKLAPATDISVQADLSKTVIAITGRMAAGGKSLAGELRASGNEAYIRFQNTWYGTKSATSKSGGVTMTTSPKALTGALSDLLGSGLDVTVEDGGTVDGVAVWKLSGSFDGAALAKALKASGLQAGATAAQSKQLAGITDLTLLVGQADALPRSIAITSTLSGAALTAAKSTTGGLVPLPAAGTKGLKSVSVTMTVGFSAWGTPVTFERPAAFKPLEGLFDELLGGLGGLGTA